MTIHYSVAAELARQRRQQVATDVAACRRTRSPKRHVTVVRRTITGLAALMTTLVAVLLLAVAATAQVPPPEPVLGPASPTLPSSVTVSHGSPLWMFAVVAVVAIAITLATIQANAKLRVSHPSTA